MVTVVTVVEVALCEEMTETRASGYLRDGAKVEKGGVLTLLLFFMRDVHIIIIFLLLGSFFYFLFFCLCTVHGRCGCGLFSIKIVEKTRKIGFQ